jgi:hypothetical protein
MAKIANSGSRGLSGKASKLGTDSFSVMLGGLSPRGGGEYTTT